MKIFLYGIIATIPWIIAYILPGYMRMLNEPISQSYRLSGNDVLVCSISSNDHLIRSLVIASPIVLALIIALTIWAYFLSSRPDYAAKSEAKRLRRIGYRAVRYELNKK